jgi:hypothetical protein
VPNPAAAPRHVQIDQQMVAGIGVDADNILKPWCGQWD